MQFYTYVHRTTEGHIFYVGKGNGRRAYKRTGRNSHWHNIVKKHGGRLVEIDQVCLSEEDALNHERFLVASFRAMGVKLANLADGGGGTSNPSSETRAKMSAAKRGRSMSEAVRQKISNAITGTKRTKEFGSHISERQRGELNHFYNQRLTDAHRAKISAAQMGDKNHRAKRILCVETQQEFTTLTEATSWIKSSGHPKARKGNVSFAALGQRPTAYGYHWKYILN